MCDRTVDDEEKQYFLDKNKRGIILVADIEPNIEFYGFGSNLNFNVETENVETEKNIEKKNIVISNILRVDDKIEPLL